VCSWQNNSSVYGAVLADMLDASRASGLWRTGSVVAGSAHALNVMADMAALRNISASTCGSVTDAGSTFVGVFLDGSLWFVERAMAARWLWL
jgi:hypothetical protein